MGQSSTAKKAPPRDAAGKVTQQRLSVLELARELGNVAEACRQRGMDRTSLYEGKRRFQTQGFEGPKDLPPIHKSHSQTTPPEVAEKIKDLALAHPAYGCNRHEAMLALEGIRVSSTTIQKILNEQELGTKIDRWLALEAQNAEKAIEITPEQAAFLEKLNPCFRERQVESSAPGGLLSADTFFVGSFTAARYSKSRRRDLITSHRFGPLGQSGAAAASYLESAAAGALAVRLLAGFCTGTWPVLSPPLTAVAGTSMAGSARLRPMARASA